jgi:hypothetical protein
MTSRRTLVRSSVGRCGRAAAAALIAVTVAFVGSSSFISAMPVLAGAGVGIDPGDIGGLPALAPSEATTVTVVVRNPGTAPADYEMIGQPLGGVPEQPVDASWFSFDPATFTLEGGATQEVAATLTLPADVEPGDYLGLLTAQLVLPDTEGSGARVGAAVATRLRFTVDAGEAAAAEPGGGGSDGDTSVLALTFVALVAVAVIAVVAVVSVKRSGLRLTREPKP